MGLREKNFCLLFFIYYLKLISANTLNIDKKILLTSDYNVHEPPVVEEGKPTLVEISINLRNILGVDERNQIISMETSLRLYWKDPRVKIRPGALKKNHDYITLNPRIAETFWIPDVFIDKAKAVRTPNYFVKPASLRIYNDSTLRYSSRLNFDVACEMDFHKFPVDHQLCAVKFESFGYTSQELQFKWKENSSNINTNISLAQFTMQVVLQDTYNTDYYELSYPGLIMKINLERDIGYHVVQTYIPSIVFVTVAWLSLFVSPESVPGRIGMGMTTLLTLTAMFGAVRNNVPKVSYISFLDIWVLVCIIFVFSCIMQFTIVTSLIQRGRRMTADKLEFFSRICIPILFLLFNCIYWPLLNKHKFNED